MGTEVDFDTYVLFPFVCKWERGIYDVHIQIRGRTDVQSAFSLESGSASGEIYGIYRSCNRKELRSNISGEGSIRIANIY